MHTGAQLDDLSPQNNINYCFSYSWYQTQLMMMYMMFSILVSQMGDRHLAYTGQPIISPLSLGLLCHPLPHQRNWGHLIATPGKYKGVNESNSDLLVPYSSFILLCTCKITSAFAYYSK